jgi:hypothetical protein
MKTLMGCHKRKDSWRNLNSGNMKHDMICHICHLVINPDLEYCEFIHYKENGGCKSHAFYHVNCFRERMNGGREVKKLQAKANLILDKVAERFA